MKNLNVSFLALSGMLMISVINSSLFGMINTTPDSLSTIRELKEKIKREDQSLSEITIEIQQLVQKVVKDCNITFPIIVFNGSFTCVSLKRDNVSNPVVLLLIGPYEESFPELFKALYHECAHIINGDIYLLSKAKVWTFLTLAQIVALSTLAGYASFKLIKPVIGSLPGKFVCFGASVAALYYITTKFGFSRIANIVCQKEREADLSACNMLMKLHYYPELTYNAIVNIKNAFHQLSYPKCVLEVLNSNSTHPSYKERAELIIAALKKEFPDLRPVLEKCLQKYPDLEITLDKVYEMAKALKINLEG